MRGNCNHNPVFNTTPFKRIKPSIMLGFSFGKTKLGVTVPSGVKVYVKNSFPRRDSQELYALAVWSVSKRSVMKRLASQSYKYSLVFDRQGSRKVLMEALEKTQQRLIIVCPWLTQGQHNKEVIDLFKNLLDQEVCIDIGWGHLKDLIEVRYTKQVQSGAVRQKLKAINSNWKYKALDDLEKLEAEYSGRFRLKLLGTHEIFLVCDDTFAMLGSHNILTSGDLSKEREVGLRTTDVNIIQGLIERFDNADNLDVAKLEDLFKDLDEEDCETLRELGITTVADLDELIREADALDDESLESDLEQMAFAVDVSPKSQVVVSGYLSGIIKVVDLSNEELLFTLSGHSNSVTSIAFSPNGRLLASGSTDETINIWNLNERVLLKNITGHSGVVKSVAFTPDGKTLASGGYDETIRLWNVKTGELLRTLSGNSGQVNSIVISPDGQSLASGNKDKTIKIWDLKTGELICTLSGHSKGDVGCIAISPDGQTLASGRYRTVELWNLNAKKLICTLSGHSASVNSIAFTSDGKTLASGSYRTVKLWDLKTGNLINTLSGHLGCIFSIAFSPNGQTLVCGGEEGVTIWQLPS